MRQLLDLFQRSGPLLGGWRLGERLLRRLGHRLATCWWRAALAACGPGTLIERQVDIERPRQVRLGARCLLMRGVRCNSEGHFGELVLEDGVQLNQDVHIDHTGGVVLEAGALLSEGCILFTHSHGYDPHSVPEPIPLRIGQGAWLGAYAMVMANVRTIGAGAVVAAGAVVTKDVPPYAVVGGNPARVIRMRPEGTPTLEEVSCG
jgi:acetyltransferase-like isoleucine patch superfamily enzyme